MRRYIGVFETFGPNVFVEGWKGRDGETIHEGMTVCTGENRSARIFYADGGFSQLGENSEHVVWHKSGPNDGARMYLHHMEIDQVFIESDLAVSEGKSETYRPPGVVVEGHPLAVFSQSCLPQGPKHMRPGEMTQISSWLNLHNFTKREPVWPKK